MLSEKEIRQILHEKKQQIEFHIKQRKIHGEELNHDFIEFLQRDIILLETILEESAWQKLMKAKNKKKSLVEITESGTIKINTWILARSEKFKKIVEKYSKFRIYPKFGINENRITIIEKRNIELCKLLKKIQVIISKDYCSGDTLWYDKITTLYEEIDFALEDNNYE